MSRQIRMARWVLGNPSWLPPEYSDSTQPRKKSASCTILVEISFFLHLAHLKFLLRLSTHIFIKIYFIGIFNSHLSNPNLM
jgi:hypothetical protein